MKIKYVQLLNEAFLTDLNFQYRPEIREWLRRTFFFTATRNDQARFEKESQEIVLDSDAINAMIQDAIL
jgi:hypothetical protein